MSLGVHVSNAYSYHAMSVDASSSSTQRLVPMIAVAMRAEESMCNRVQGMIGSSPHHRAEAVRSDRRTITYIRNDLL